MKRLAPFIPALAMVSLASAQTVEPILDDVINDLASGQTYATFGYISTYSNDRNIQYGATNYFTPVPAVRLQPTEFFPGTQNSVFTTSFSPSETLQWVVLQNYSPVADPSTAPSGVTAGATYSHTAGVLDAALGLVIDGPNAYLLTDGATFRQTGGSVNTTTATVRSGGTLELAGDEAVFTATNLSVAGLLKLQGGKLNSSLSVTSNGTVRVEAGRTELQGTFTNAGTLLSLGGEFVSDSDLTNEGRMQITGGTIVAPSMVNRGTLVLDGGSLAVATLNNNGQFDWRSGTVRLTGNLVSDGSTFLGQNPSLAPSQSLEILGTTTVTTGHFLNVSPDSSFSTMGGSNAGRIYVTAALFESKAVFTNASILSAVDSTLRFSGSSGRLENQGTLNLTSVKVEGDVHTAAGSIINIANSVTFHGRVSGAGNFTGTGRATFEGGYSPGDSAALVTHSGDAAFTLGNVLTLEIAGTSRGSGYDALAVGGELELAGTLQIDLNNGFTPVLGDQFDLFDWGALQGSFSTLNLPALNSGLSWDLSSLYWNGAISVIPEPSGVLLMELGLVGITLLRRRPRSRNKTNVV